MACQCFLHGPDAVVDYRSVLEVYNQQGFHPLSKAGHFISLCRDTLEFEECLIQLCKSVMNKVS